MLPSNEHLQGRPRMRPGSVYMSISSHWCSSTLQDCPLLGKSPMLQNMLMPGHDKDHSRKEECTPSLQFGRY